MVETKEILEWIQKWAGWNFKKFDTVKKYLKNQFFHYLKPLSYIGLIITNCLQRHVT
jgi:hypothetical protein